MWYNREGYLGMKGDFMNENISLPEFMRNELVIKTQKELRQRKGYLISKRIFDIVVFVITASSVINHLFSDCHCN